MRMFLSDFFEERNGRLSRHVDEEIEFMLDYGDLLDRFMIDQGFFLEGESEALAE